MYEAYLACSRKTGLHQVLRVVPSSPLGGNRPPAPFADAFNALVCSNNTLELLEAIDGLPLLVPTGRLGGEKRAFTVNEALGMLERGKWVPCRPDTIEYEAHFDAGMPSEHENRRRATSMALKHRDAHAAGLDGILEITDQKEARVIAEPLLDWTFARNLLGLSARLLHEMSAGDPSHALEAAGFVRDKSKPLRRNVYRIPFAFNPFFTDGIAFLMNYEKLNPLMERTLTLEKPPSASLKPVKWRFKEGVGVYVVTAPVATGEYRKIFQDRKSVSEKRYYLCIEDQGEGQAQLADDCVKAFAHAVMNLTADGGEPLGWEFDEECLVDGSPAPSFTGGSMLPDFMYRLLFRASRSEGIAICASCGNAMLVGQGRGKPRMFCSDACRMRHKRGARE